MDKKELYRKIPKVDKLLKEPCIEELCCLCGKGAVLEAVRKELGLLRSMAEQGEAEEISASLNCLNERIREQTMELCDYPLKRVFNATGIILHTNLGRAPLGKNHREAMEQVIHGYCDLEYDLKAGCRGKRLDHFRELAKKVTGAEGAAAVNNNAAAVTLMLTSIARGKEVIVSRGELIEIGGRFRIPEVMEQSGAILRETGCTNRTRISDYEQAINENTGALLKVHTSNYKILGFTQEVSVEELCGLGKKYQLPVLVDLGSGVLVNLEKYGLPHEPTVQEVLKKGADVVCFSGDKLLGGPQAGILAGRREYIERMEGHPLMRALRLDKCTVAALAAVFRDYLDEEQAERNIPVLQMLKRTREELRTQAEEICGELLDCAFPGEIFVKDSISVLGGGSMPTEEIPSCAVVIRPERLSCEALCAELRRFRTPIVSYIKNDCVYLDMRTVLPEEKEGFLGTLKDGLKKMV